MPVLRQALGDATVMGVWVFLSSIFDELSTLLSASLGISPLAAGLTVLCLGLALYEPICSRLGGQGASFNPSQNFAFAAAGKGSLFSHTVRSAAQAMGGVIGAFAALTLIPSAWQGKFSNYAHGVMPGVSLMGGALSEAILSFLLNIAILWSMESRYKTFGKLLPYIATVILVPLGAELSGPFMNPAFAFSWFVHLQGPDLWEHIAVFWLGCLSGSYLAGWCWFFFTTPAKTKPRRPSRLSNTKPSLIHSKNFVTAGAKKSD